MAVRERNYRNLKVWQAAHELALLVYATSGSLPMDERFGVTAQVRRCASSIASNLAEGSGRRSAQAFAAFVDIAYASSAELDYQLLLARDLGWLERETHHGLALRIAEIQRMLAVLRRTLLAANDGHRSLAASSLAASR